MMQLQEHEPLIQNGLGVDLDKRYNNLDLIKWSKPTEKSPWGYYASFIIGAEWIDENEPLIVTTKRDMEKIDFLGMFMTCFSSNLALSSFSKIYKIDLEKPAINAPTLCSIVSPLIVIHFLCIVDRIKSLKKGYVHHCENLKKVKGHIKLLKNERVNISQKRYDRIFCEYDDYSTDIPENRLLKMALLFSEALINGMSKQHSVYPKIKLLISKTLTKFDGVTDDVDIKSVGQIRSHKLFSDYAEAIRLAKIILKRFDYSINKVSSSDNKVIPFTLDMSLLYEHYVYGLLNEAYQDNITYQLKGKTGYPDFLFKSKKYKAILDTKYIPKYENQSLETYVVRQLSGYSRDIPILRHLGYDDMDESSPIPSVPCVIIYPKEGTEIKNPFLNKDLSELCSKPISKLSMFYKLSIPVPTITK